MGRPKGRGDCSSELRRTVWAQRGAQGLGDAIELCWIDSSVCFTEVDIGFGLDRQHVKMGMGNFKTRDDERDPLGVERLHLRRTDLPRNDCEMAGNLVREVNPMVDLESRDNKRVSRANRGNREECDTDVIPVDETSREFAVDDLGEQGAHGFRIVECGG